MEPSKAAVPLALRSLAKALHIEEDETQALTRTIARTLNERFDTTRRYAHADVLRDELERWSVRRENEDVRRAVTDHRSTDIESRLVDRSETARSRFDTETYRTAVENDLRTVRRAEALFESTRRVRNDVETALNRSVTHEVDAQTKRTAREEIESRSLSRLQQHDTILNRHREALESARRVHNDREETFTRTVAGQVPIIVDLRSASIGRSSAISR